MVAVTAVAQGLGDVHRSEQCIALHPSVLTCSSINVRIDKITKSIVVHVTGTLRCEVDGMHTVTCPAFLHHTPSVRLPEFLQRLHVFTSSAAAAGKLKPPP
jgi:hypothetical protein